MFSSSAETPVQLSDEQPAPRRARLRFLVLGIAIAAILAAILFGVRGSDGGTKLPREGDELPKVSLPLLNGAGQLKLPGASTPKLRGTVVSFFASWCGPCRTELPMVVKTSKAYLQGGKGQVRFVGIDGLDQPSKAKAFLEQVGWTFPVGADTSFSVTSGTFGFQALPETIVADAHGVITYVKIGELSRAELTNALNALPAA